MSKIQKYNDFINEESRFKDIVIGLGTILSLGLSKLDAQQIKNKPQALSVIDTCDSYNQYVKQTQLDNKRLLTNSLENKVKNPIEFMNSYIHFLPDKTIVISPDFIKGLDLNLNPNNREFGFRYTVKF